MEVFTSGAHSDMVVFSDTLDQHNKIPTDHNHYVPHPHPPQKLRPIRCSVRTSFTSDNAKPLTRHPDSDFYNNTQIEIEAGGNFITPQPISPLGLPPSQTQAALSSSSDKSSKLQEAVKEPVNKNKRKRKSREKLKSFIRSMMNTVLENQEEMHRQLIELLEMKENESIMRQQAWEQQEIERAVKYEQARKQEMSRSLALISFIQKSLGQEVHIPNPPDASNQGENQNEENLKGNTDNLEKNEVQIPNPHKASYNGIQVENPTEETLNFDVGDVNLKRNDVNLVGCHEVEKFLYE